MPRFKNDVSRMVRISKEQTGCCWCRHFRKELSSHLVACAKSKNPMVRHFGCNCSKFIRGLKSSKSYPVRLFDGCTLYVPGLYLNLTDIEPGDLIAGMMLYKLLQVAVLDGDIHLKIKRKP